MTQDRYSVVQAIESLSTMWMLNLSCMDALLSSLLYLRLTCDSSLLLVHFQLIVLSAFNFRSTIASLIDHYCPSIQQGLLLFLSSMYIVAFRLYPHVIVALPEVELNCSRIRLSSQV